LISRLHAWKLPNRLSMRSSLVLIVAAPLAVSIGLASSVVAREASLRAESVRDRNSSITLDSVVQARFDINAEQDATIAILAAASYHVSGAELDRLLGANYQHQLVTSRRTLDRLTVLRSPALSAAFARVVALRSAVDYGVASLVQVRAVFAVLTGAVDADWQASFQRLSNESSASDMVRARAEAVGNSFSAFTSGLAEEDPEETLLSSAAGPGVVSDLIEVSHDFETSTARFPEALGPQGVSAWKALNRDPLTKVQLGAVQLAITVGLSHAPPPYGTDITGLARVAQAEEHWTNSLRQLVLASSADLRAATINREAAATLGLYLTDALLVLLALVTVGGLALLDRAIRRPLGQIIAAAHMVRKGDFELPWLDEDGVRELNIAAGALNEMAATLRAVQSQAVALSSGHLDDPVLKAPLPGLTGAALQVALVKLLGSVQASEVERELLLERATRDDLTGLLNRGAALDALDRDLARVRRDKDRLDLVVLFVDLDDLKAINDTLGHDGGDAAIVATAEALRSTTRTSDVVGRLGGDEFIVGWIGMKGSDAPKLLAERICHRVASSNISIDGVARTLGCSIGVAWADDMDPSIDAVIRRADQALYLAKAEGEGRVHVQDLTGTKVTDADLRYALGQVR